MPISRSKPDSKSSASRNGAVTRSNDSPGKAIVPLRDGQDLAGEAEAAQLVEEGWIVALDPSQIGQVFFAVAKIPHEGQRRLQPGRQQVGATKRRGAGVEIEGRLGVQPRSPAHVGGIDMVEIGQQATIGVIVRPHRPFVPNVRLPDARYGPIASHRVQASDCRRKW